MNFAKLFTAATLAFSSAAFALTCEQANLQSGEDAVYKININDDQTEAYLSDLTSKQDIAELLKCSEAVDNGPGGNRGINPTYPLVNCLRANKSLALTLYFAPVTHVYTARMNEVKSDGSFGPTSFFDCK